MRNVSLRRDLSKVTAGEWQGSSVQSAGLGVGCLIAPESLSIAKEASGWEMNLLIIFWDKFSNLSKMVATYNL